VAYSVVGCEIDFRPNIFTPIVTSFKNIIKREERNKFSITREKYAKLEPNLNFGWDKILFKKQIILFIL